MPDKLIFLSHIHEEKDLAVLIKNALEDEFSGFVDVFVSSDGTSIPAGSNFLKGIENALIHCIGAVYLISPVSVKRNWINFELGAMWIRNILSLRSEGPEIPTLPVCHSGMLPSNLPSPLNNLNAITASQASGLQFAFRSLQSAVGGRGSLKTDFNDLASKVVEFEHQYTLGLNLKEMLILLKGDIGKLVAYCESLEPQLEQKPKGTAVLECGFIQTSIIQTLKHLEANELSGYITVSVLKPTMNFTRTGAVNGGIVEVNVLVSLVLRFKEQLMK